MLLKLFGEDIPLSGLGLTGPAAIFPEIGLLVPDTLGHPGRLLCGVYWYRFGPVY